MKNTAEIQRLLAEVERLKAENASIASDHLAKLPLEVKRIRTERGITQEQLAKAARISRTQMVNLEAGRSCITTERLVLMCIHLGTTPNDLLGFDSPPPLAPANGEGVA